MKKGAIALAALCVLLAILLRSQMGACDVTHELITPDGTTFRFTGERIVPGTVEQFNPLEGRGLPPVEHITQDIYGMPGELLKDTVVKPRTITFTTTTHGITQKTLYQIRAKLNDTLRLDRGAKGAPSIYRQTVNGVARDLYVHYSGDVTRTVGRFGLVEIVGIRFTAYDPFWYDPETQEQVLDFSDPFTTRAFIERTPEGWGKKITQPVAIAGGAIRVYAMAKDPNTGDVYFGGVFTDWDNNLLSDNLVRWRAATDTWENVGTDGVGGPAITNTVVDMCFDPAGRYLYVAGVFHSAGGIGAAADHVARVDVTTDTWEDVGGGHVGGGVATQCSSCAFGHDGTFYLGGIFADWAGSGADNLVSWNGLAWSQVGGLNPDDNVKRIVIAPNGDVYICGAFINVGAVARNYIAYYDGTSWHDLDSGLSSVCGDMAFGPNGLLYAAGNFLTAGSAPVTVNFVACWNGFSWSGLDSGTNGTAYCVGVDEKGIVWVSGGFDRVGSGPLLTCFARWNGYAWSRADMDFDDTVHGFMTDGDELYFGHAQNPVTIGISGTNQLVNLGNAFSLPIIEVKNQGTVYSIRNEMIGGTVTEPQDIPCNMLIQDGEIVTFDLSAMTKTVTSNWRGNRLGDIFPSSDLGSFCLESNPRAAYGGDKGANLITAFITGADPREHNDDNNQLSGWEGITGISQGNTDLGRLYAWITDHDGGTTFHVDFYKDRTLWDCDNEILTPGFEIDTNADGLADNWGIANLPTLTMESTIVLQGFYSQKIVTRNLLGDGIGSDAFAAPAGVTSGVCYVWIARPAAGSDMAVDFYDSTAGVVRGSARYNTAGWPEATAKDGLTTFYRVEIPVAAGIVPGNNHRIRMYNTAATATTFYVDKAYWKWDTTMAPDEWCDGAVPDEDNMVGHTDLYVGAGIEPIFPMGCGGIGGTITVDALVGADDDIMVWFTIVTMFWRDRWWDLDSAISAGPPACPLP